MSRIIDRKSVVFTIVAIGIIFILGSSHSAFATEDDDDYDYGSYVDGEITYSYIIKGNETATITGFSTTSGYDGTIGYPGEIEGKPVVKIHDSESRENRASSNDYYSRLRFDQCSSLQTLELEGIIDNSESLLSSIPRSLINIELWCEPERSASYRNMAQNPVNLDLTQFEQLESFVCSGLYINKLNLSGLNNLKKVKCTSLWDDCVWYGTTKSVDLSECANLESALFCGIQLTTINLRNSKALKELFVNSNYDSDSPDSEGHMGNNLTSLDLTSCTNLQNLNCKGNKLSKLNLKYCKKLRKLNCEDNCLAMLNVKANNKLAYLYCSYNNLQKITLPAGKKIKGDCRHNFLKRNPTLKMIKRFGKKKTKPQDKIATKSVGKVKTKCTAGGNGKLIINCDVKEYNHVSKFQIQYRVKGAKNWATLNNGLRTTKTLTGLKSGKTYNVRARAKLKVGKKWFTGKWSTTRTVTVQ